MSFTGSSRLHQDILEEINVEAMHMQSYLLTSFKKPFQEKVVVYRKELQLDTSKETLYNNGSYLGSMKEFR